jgi:hypothetical protein
MEETAPEKIERCTDYDDDSGMWEAMRAAQEASRERKRSAMHNISARLKILDRVEFINEGTCLLDGRVYYYAQKKKARVKGEKKYYQMRGFEHFVKVFGRELKPNPTQQQPPFESATQDGFSD